MRDELTYNVRNKMNDELVKIIEKSYLFNNTSNEKDIKDMKVSNDELDYLIISNYKMIILIINDIVDLNHQRFNENRDNDNLLYSNNDITINDNTKFNLENLVKSISVYFQSILF